MSPEQKIAALHALLDAMPRADRLGCLVLAIIEQDSDALEVSLRMINATHRMSSRLSKVDKFRVAEKLRDTADRLERAMERA